MARGKGWEITATTLGRSPTRLERHRRSILRTTPSIMAAGEQIPIGEQMEGDDSFVVLTKSTPETVCVTYMALTLGRGYAEDAKKSPMGTPSIPAMEEHATRSLNFAPASGAFLETPLIPRMLTSTLSQSWTPSGPGDRTLRGVAAMARQCGTRTIA